MNLAELRARLEQEKRDIEAFERVLKKLEAGEIPAEDARPQATKPTSKDRIKASLVSRADAIAEKLGRDVSIDDLFQGLKESGKKVDKLSLAGAIYRDAKLEGGYFKKVGTGRFRRTAAMSPANGNGVVDHQTPAL